MLTNALLLERIFSMANLTAVVAWLILWFFPRRWYYVSLIPTVAVPILLSFAYSAIIFVIFFQGDGGDFSSLEGVKTLLKNDASMLAAWIHFLAFDLFIGGIIAQRADAIGLSRALQFPILFFTFMAGPLGFFLFQFTHGGWRLIKPMTNAKNDPYKEQRA